MQKALTMKETKNRNEQFEKIAKLRDEYNKSVNPIISIDVNYNNHQLFMGDIILTMKDLGIRIEMVEDDVFQNALSSAMKDPLRVESLTSLIAYQNMARGKVASPVATQNDYTTEALLRLGWRWPETSSEYLHKFLEGLIGLGMFGDLATLAA